MGHCLICTRIRRIKDGTNPYFVAELESGYVVIGDHQFFRGYTLLLAKQHAGELHDLDWSERTRFLQDMALTAEAVCKAFHPQKLNYELLGNGHAHMHWHIFPRHHDDPNPTGPVWEIDSRLTTSDRVRPSVKELAALKSQLADQLTALRSKYRQQ